MTTINNTAGASAAEMMDNLRSEAAELRNFTITFLSLLLYVWLIVVATDHEQILRNTPVKLPLLDVDIPLLGFYGFMPPFLFFIHLYILIQHYLFSQYAFQFEKTLKRERISVQKDLRHRLGDLPFLHWLLGQHKGLMQLLMTLISIVSLIVITPLMFWLMQVRFLPYHDEGIVLCQEIFLTLDVMVLAYVWPKTLHRDDKNLAWWLLKTNQRYAHRKEWFYLKCLYLRGRIELSPVAWSWHYLIRIVSVLTTLVLQYVAIRRNPLCKILQGVSRVFFGLWLIMLCFLSWLVSVPPDSSQEQWWLAKVFLFENKATELGLKIEPINNQPKYWLLESVTYNSQSRWLFKPTTWLHEKIVTDKKLEEIVKNHDPARVFEVTCPIAKEQHGKSKKPLAEQGSDPKCYEVDAPLPRNLILREKVLTADANLKPELAAALQSEQIVSEKILNKINPIDLQSRNFDYSDFSNSTIPGANMQRASMRYANFHEARLNRVQMTMAVINNAVLDSAKLHNANLSRTSLHNADLSRAELDNTNLTFAELHGAFILATNLNGGDLSGTEFNGAYLYKAIFKNTELHGASFHGADLTNTEFHGANFD
ncbi:hypothetical protein VZ94_08120 [Methylocucumis oryzae]|uniref:Pentapeptide repeat-containing protein n=2 Tax=Methylocucumis oryzae TaxID=1632867 RepID=A0A0F3IJT4_9GAMM|nr:hypothetical protein VZ94_08120 [Methylocucumis oryzae]